MSITPRPRLHSVAVLVEAGQYLAGWRPEAGALFLPALGEASLGDEAAVRVGIAGQAIRATLFGRVALVRRVGRPSLPPGVELVLDPVSLPAATFLAVAAHGEAVSFRERAQRWVVERRLPALRARSPHEARTINVSEGGCAVAWPDELPEVGEVLELKLGSGLFAATARGVVCWVARAGPLGRSLGLRVLAGGRATRAWRSFANDAARHAVRAA
jgi:Tfp pilus assembly protein PilZ